MSKLPSSANEAQLIEILNSMAFPVMGAGGGFAPIGTINFFDASVAPNGWLACNGQEVNISDYPELATYYASVHGSSNFYGGNGTTTFAVPDLRGEFLRGTGTNSHTNQGNGANVGVHQDGTVSQYVGDSGGYITAGSGVVSNYDSNIGGTTYRMTGGTTSAPKTPASYTSRPTNTSFLICVKATVAGDPNAHHYSTDEQVVEKWIDGSDIYERTVTGLNVAMSTNDWTNNIYPLGDTVNRILECRLFTNDNVVLSYPIEARVLDHKLSVQLRAGGSRTLNSFTIRYTKTS